MSGVPLRAQTAGQNVNMVSGTGWTNGDPFLERQNEPSITVSTRNSAHLFGAANDYRSVDLPGLLGIDERGDAWLGVYKSFDGGLTWQSTLLPGFPLDGSLEGLASPIHGRQAAADPLVRAGSNGLFFLTGLAFDRGSSPPSKVFITRFIDLNNKENGDATSENGSLTNLAPRDPVKYIDTHIIDTGSANRFLDKPWVAVDIPRSRATCTISANQDGNTVTQKIPAGAIYVTYTAFTTVGTVQNSQILFRRSMDCGVTWSKPIVLSQSDESPNMPEAEGQGTVIAIDPSVPAADPATIYVAWRVFAEPGDPDDANQIRIAKSTNGGLSFDEQEAAVTFPLSCNKKPTGVGCPFDQGETGTSFRSNGYPALTVDNAGRVYLAWSQRDSNGDGRIMMAVTNNVESWPKSNFREIDSGPVYDDYGNPLSNLSDRGGQLMPTLNFNAGKLMLTYYDLRQDHTSGSLTPAPEPTCNPAITPLCPIGNPFSELRQLEGELLTNPLAVFNAYIDDATLTVRRHTLDIVGSEGSPDPNRWSLAVPSFSHFRVSRYEYGIIPPGTDIQQAQFNAPNLPMFVQGTAPFMGDYIDVTGAPSMVPDNSRNSDGWKFNTSPTTNPVFHATWTDNRDVLPPPDGVSWNKYTPPISASIGPTSKFDPTKTPPACVSGYSGMRNQNIYTSAISNGLILTSPQTAKPVLQANGQPIPREFALIMRNDTNDSRTFLLTVPAQPASAQASFLQFGLQTTLTVNIPALSSASRPVFLTPNPGSTVSFPSFEVDALETDGAQPALTASILFNADPTNPFLANPDNAAFGSGSISSQEFYNPAILNPAILNPAILNPAILNPAILNPAILNPAILNPAILNPAILNPNFVVALNPAILNPAILNPAILNNAVANPAILNPAILNTPVSDANYTITNEGNTSATYQLQLFQSGALPASAVFQIILTKTYLTPGVSPTDGCTYGGQVNNEVIASIDNPAFVTNPAQLGNPAILNSAINNPTFSMAPGDTVQITLRANLTVPELANVVLPNLTPVVAAQAVNTVDVAKGITTPPISLLISTTSLPTGVTGQAYSATLTALGGNPPLTADVWSLVGGSLPPGLNLSAAGVVSGSPTSSGTFPFVAEVVDAGAPQHVASRQLSITVVAPVAITTPSPALPEGGTGTLYTETFTATGGVPPYAWTNTGAVPPGLTLGQNGLLSGIPTAGGTFTFTVNASDTLGLVASLPYTIVITNPVVAGAQLLFSAQPGTTTAGQPISPPIRVQTLDGAGAAVPGVTITLGAGTGPNRPILSGTLSAVTDATGTATFSNVIVDRAGTGFTLVASAAGVSSSGAVQRIAAPPSVQQGALESDSQIQLFNERRGVSLGSGVAVDVTAPGTYSSTASLTSGTIAAGTLVDSYYLHADPVGISRNITQLQAGGVTFPTPILGVIVLDPEFNASDAALGVNGTLYPASGRSLTLGSPTDTAILSADGRTLTLQLSDSSATADVRVITAANANISFGQTTSAAFNTVAGTGFITTVAGSTWSFPSEVSPLNAPLGLGADLIGGLTGIASDGVGNLYFADPNNQMVFKISDGTLSIVAGTGIEGYAGDGGPATAARLDFPESVALSPAGELYIADSNNSVIRKVDATGKITTVVGNGTFGDSGDGGQAVSASLSGPEGITFDAVGNLFIADTGNGVIRKVDTTGTITSVPVTNVPANSGLCIPEAVAQGPAGVLYVADTCRNEVLKLDSGGNLTIVAGNNTSGYSGDGGPATGASLSNPIGIAFDAAGNLFIADEFNSVVREVSTAGIITTAVGNGGLGFSGDGGSGLLATMAQPGALAFDPFGNLYVGDMTNERIRRVDPSGTITTVAGNGRFKYAGDGGLATAASLDSPIGNTVDQIGNLFVADINNEVIRKIDSAGLISSYAGTGVLAPNYLGDGGPATSAPLAFPIGVRADGAGNIYLTEGGRVHKINPSGVITTLVGFNGFANSVRSSNFHLALDSQGSVYLSSGNRVFKLDTTGALSIVAGSAAVGGGNFSGDGGPATLAKLSNVRDVAVDLTGNLYIADSGNGRIRRVDLNGIITTVAGNGTAIFSGDGGAATSAGVPGPFGLAVDGAGNLYIGSAGRVRKVDANGIISTIAGGGFVGPTVDGIPATNAAFTNVQGLAFDAAGNLYLTDRFNDRVRKITGVTNAPPFIFNPPTGLTVATKGLAHGGLGSPYFQTLSAVGGAPPYIWSIASGALPAGLNLSAAGAISGTPTASGVFPFTVQATDSTGVTATQSLTITLSSQLAITTPSLPGGTVGVAYSQTLTATGGAGGYIWNLAPGTLPPDLTLSSNGVLGGTPTTPGTYTFSVAVTDSLGLTAAASYTIIITTVTSQQPARVAFVVQPTNVVGSQAITPTVQVQVLDATGAAIPNTPVGIAFANQACSAAVLSGSVTATTNASGLASFSNLSIDRGQLAYTLRATAGNATAVSNPFTVNGFCKTGSMATARALQSSLALPNGKILIAGGSPSFSNISVALSSAELYDPATKAFTTIGSMNVGRMAFSMTPLQNGLVLVTGGFGGSGYLSSAELFDPATNTFTLLAGSMVAARSQSTATLLPNGKVLITGGINGTVFASAEIFDPATNTFTATSHPMTTPRGLHEAALLSNGKVLITGGFSTFVSNVASDALASAELYDPVADTFASTGSMATPRYEHASALLSTGKVLVAGGVSGNGFTVPLGAAEIYDPSTGTFSATGSAPEAVAAFLSPVPVLPDGTAFLASGGNAQIYDPVSGAFQVTGNTTAVQDQPQTSLVADGTVLVTGGSPNFSTAVADAEIYYSTAPLAPLSITTTSPLFAASVGTPFTQILLEEGGVGTLTWTLASGALPPGIALSSNGILQGTPTTGGTFAFTVQVVDSSTPQKTTTSGTLTLTVSVPVAPLVLVPQTLPTDFTSITSYAPSLAASGGTPPYKFAVTSGALPTGITLGTNGTFSGSSTTVGTFTFGVTVTDSSAPAQTATQTFTIQVAAPLAITTTTLPGGTAGAAYNANISSTGGVLPVGFAVTAGALPPGLQLALASAPPQTATLSGTPAAAGTFNFTITASDSSNPTQVAPQSYTVTIAQGTPPTTLVSVNPNTGFQGQQNLSVGIIGQSTHFTQGTTVADFGSGVQVQSLTVGSPTTATAVLNINAVPNAGIQLNFFPNSVYNADTAAMDAALGTTGYTIDSFETTPLLPGLTIQLSGGVATTTWTSLPNLLDGDVCPGLTSGQAWDGTDTASNQISNQITGCSGPSGLATLTTFNYAPGATSFGIGLSNFQSVNPPSPQFPVTNHELFVNGVDMGVLETLAGAAWSPGLTRNAYLRIDGTNGGVITSVGFENLSSTAPVDFLMFDHLAVLPSATAARNVTMTTNSEVATLPNGFTVNTNPLPPAIASVNPNTAAQGRQNLSVAITGVSTHFVQGTTTANFGARITAISLTVTSATNATAVLNIDPAAVTGARNVTLTTGAEAATLANGFTVTIAPAPLAITTATLPSGTAGAAYSATVTSSGGTAPVSFSVSTGTLPPGLALASSGAQSSTLSGTPTTAGTFTFKITATDSFVPAATASQSYTVTIAPAVVPPANVVFVTPLQNSIEGQVLTASPVQVRVMDATNNPLPNASVTMGFNGAPPCAAATLGGTLTQITDATGTATFPDLAINRGQFGFTLAATAGSVAGVSNSFNVEGFCDTGGLATSRVFHSAVALPNGSILVAGGAASYNASVTSSLSSAELYSPVTHSFTTVGSMHVPRNSFTMTLLQNGLVLVAGGYNGTTQVSSAELFDTSTNTFTLLSSSMTAPRYEHTATLLASGKVLVTGGGGPASALSSAELFDPVSNTFTATTGAMTAARSLHDAVLLPNGQVLITGGVNGNFNPIASAELYDPITNTFSSTGSMATPREQHASASLYDGTVLVAGGFTGASNASPTATAEIYNPSTGVFSSTVSAAELIGGFYASVPVLADGRVFLVGFNTDALVYDPAATTFRTTGHMTTSQGQAQTALLPDGTVLAVGGTDSTGTGVANAEIFYPINVVPISITTVLPTALVNVLYSQQLLEKGGVGALTWTVSSGTLPAGLTLSPGGLLSGTPTVIGVSTFTVQVTDSSTPPRNATANFIVAVVPPVTVIPVLPTANPGVAYSIPLLIAGGAPPYMSSIISGALPAGLTLSNGTVSGTTTAASGNYTFTVQVTDSSSPPVTVTQAVTMTVAPALAFVTTALPGGQANIAYPTTTITTSGGSGAVQIAVESGALPTGLTLTPQGVLSGTPTVASTFTFTLVALDSSADPQLVTETLTIVIAPALTPVTLGPASLPAATLGAAYSQNFSVSGGTPPYTVTQTGTLPPGLTFNGAANPASITGTPTALGTFANIVVTAQDSLGTQAQVRYSIIVNAFSASCGTGNEALFNGQYAVLMQGFDANGPRTLIGSIAPNGAGGFVSGQLDIGTDLPAGGGAAQHLTIILAQSSFSVGADRRGCMVLTTSAGSSSYRFVLATVNNGISTGGRIIDFQQNGAYGAGYFSLQDSTFLATPSLNGSYAFGFSTPSSVANIGHWGMLGAFNASGGVVSAGSWDYNDTRTIDAGSAWATSGLSFPANETYAFDSTGRGTIQLPSVQQYSQSNTLVSANVVVYPINANQMYAAVLPDANNKPLVGDVQQQITPFSSLTLNGAGFVDGVSSAPIFSGAWVGLFSASQNAWNLSLDNDFADIYSTNISNGTYAVDSTGRTPLAFTGSASAAPMLRVIGPNKAYFMLADSTSAVGFVHGFSGGVPPSSVAGSYAIGPTEGTMDRKVTNLSGVAVFDAAGNVTFTEDQATGSTNTLTPGAVFTSTYSYNASTGRGVIPPTGTPHYVFDATGLGTMYLLDVSSVDPEVQQLDAFSPPAVTLFPDPLDLIIGGSGTMNVVLGTAATGNGQIVTLTSSNASVASVPASVTVLPGATGASFTVTAGAISGSADINASVAGLPATNATVNVTQMTLALSLPGPLLGVGRSFNAAVTLANPAGINGVTVTLASSDTTIATVSPASITIPQGGTTATFAVNGIATGTVILTVGASGFQNATTSLTITNSLISLQSGTVTVAPGQSGSVAVSLSGLAPTGGITITFSSGNTAVATITPNVFVPQGQQVPAANPQVTGVAIGATVITASATGFAPDTAPVQVTVTASFSPTSLSIPATRTNNITLNISAPAPQPNGVTFNLSSDNTNFVTVPATAVIPAGQLSITVPVTGVAQGSATVSATSAGITTATAPVNVGAAPTMNINVSTNLGQNLQVDGESVSLSASAPANENLTLASNSANVLLATTPAGPFSQSITLPLAINSFSVPSFSIQGLASSGTAQLTAQAVGYGNGSATVTLTPSGIQWVSGNFNITTFSPNTNLTMASYQLSPTTLAAQSSQNIRTGLSASVAVTSSDTTIGTIVVSPVTINADTNTTTVAFHPVAPGTTNLLIATPSGFTTPTGVGSTSLTATVNSPNLTINATTNLGQNLQADNQSISLEASPPGNETLTLTSNSPNLLIANTPAGPFSQSINLALSQGSFSVPGFSTQSLANTGTAQLTAVAPGYNNGILTINLTPSAIEWVSGNFTTTTFSANSTLTLAAYQLNPATLTAQASQNIRTGASVSITVTSSDTTIGTIVTSPVTMNADTNTTTVLFHPVASGTANLLIATPTGFTTPTGAGSNSIAATVNAPNLSINVSTNLGQNLQVDGESVSLGAAPPGNETLTVTSNSPNVLIANTPAGPFSQSITLALSQGSFSVPGFSMQGLAGTGTAQLTASAAGYNSGTATINLTPSAIEWLSGNFNTTTFTPNSTLTLASYQLNPSTLTAQASQNIRTGSTVSVTVTSSAPTVGTILNSPITISGDTNTATVGFHPLTAGTANLVIATPTGFTTPSGAGSNTITATVSAPNLNINVSTNLGQNLQADNQSISLAAAPPNNETLTLSSSSAAVLLATTPAGPFSQSITLPLSQGSFSVPGFSMQGLAASGSAQLTAQAPGYTDATATIALTPSAIEWLSGDFNTTTFTPNTTLTLAAYQLNPATLTAQASQNLRTGLPVSVTVTSSNTAVGTIVSSPVIISADTNTTTVSFHPVAAGTANLLIATPAGFTTPNGPESNSISATVSAPNLTINVFTNLGQNLQVDGESISLGAAPPSSETLTLSSNSSNLLLATTSAGPFSQSITLPLTAGSFSVPGFSMQGLASSGSAQLTASALGYSNGTVTINLTPSAIEWLSGNFTTTTFSPNTTLTLASYQLNPANLTAQASQNIRTGLNVSVTVTTSDSTIGTIVGSPVTLNADTNTITVLFHPVGAGTANLLIATPTGFTAPNGAGSSSITATVNAPNLNINASSNLGQNLQVDNESISLGAAPTSSETLTLTSSSAAVLLATAPAGPFSQSITLPLAAGSFSVPNFSMQGLASTGSAQLTASAPGYNNGTFTVALTPSAIEWNSGNFSTTTFSADSTLSIASYQLSPATLTAQTSQNLRAGLSVSVTITSSDTTIGTILVSPVTINADSNVTSVVFHPVAAGTVNLVITTPAGFTTPNGPTSSSIAATVNAPNLNVNVVPNLGQDLQVDNESVGLGAAPPTSRTLTLTSGSAALLLATTPAGPFSQSITLPLTAGSFTVPGFSIQALAGSGTAQITASAPGYSNGTSTVTLTPSGIIWESASFSTTAGSANTNLTVLAAQLSPTTLTAQSFQNIRTGSSVSVTVTSSVTTVGTIVTSPVAINAGSDSAALAFHPVSSGVTNLVITTPAGFATPNGSGATSISATVN